VLTLALMFGAVLLIGVAVDILRLVSAWREVNHLASVAAESAAGWVIPTELYAGRLVVDPAQADAAARRVIAADADVIDIDVAARQVCVSVGIEVMPRLGRLVGAGPRMVVAASCAEPHQG
jgi:hypothetical protein